MPIVSFEPAFLTPGELAMTILGTQKLKNAWNSGFGAAQPTAAFSIFLLFCELQRTKLLVAGRTPCSRRVHPHVRDVHLEPIAQVRARAILAATTSYVHVDHKSVLVRMQN